LVGVLKLADLLIFLLTNLDVFYIIEVYYIQFTSTVYTILLHKNLLFANPFYGTGFLYFKWRRES